MPRKTPIKKTTAAAKPVKTEKVVKTTKPVRKTTTKMASVVKSHVDEEMTPKLHDQTETSRKSLRVKKSYVILVVILLALVVFLYFGRSWIVAAVVNGQPISRMAVVHEAEKASGKQALNNLVRNILIEQEAKKENVSVNDKEVDDELKKVESNLTKQGQKLDQVLAMQGMSRSDLRNLIRLDKLVGKMVGKSVKISDKDVKDYIDKNKDLLPKDQSDSQLKATVTDRLKQQQLNEKVQTWLSDLQTKAQILYFVNY